MQISVVVPAYNTARFIVETLESIHRQTMPAAEIVVVDDGSTDDTGAVAEAWAAGQGAPVRVVRQPNAGVAAARNRGIREARSAWIAFLDSDDIYEPTALETFRAGHAAFPDTPWIAGDLALVSEDLGRVLTPSLRDRPRVEAELSDAFASGRPTRLRRPWEPFLRACLTMTGATAIRRDLLLAQGGFREDLRQAEDYQLWVRLARRADFVFVPRVVYRYRDRPGSLMNAGLPPRLWARRAFRQLSTHYDIPADHPILRARLCGFEREDALFLARAGRPVGALTCAARAVSLSQGRREGWSLLARAAATSLAALVARPKARQP